jgi:hypothetical protein
MFNWARTTLALLLVFSTSHFASRAQTPQSDDALVGIWAYETKFDSGPSGDLIVFRQRRRVAREYCEHRRRKLSRKPTTCAFDFAGKGEFRGKVNAKGDAIDGFWIRP